MEGLKTSLELQPNDFVTSHDFLLLTETMDVKDTEITGFTCYSSPAVSHDVGRPSGGIAIAISKNIQSNSCIIFRSQHVLIVKAKTAK